MQFSLRFHSGKNELFSNYFVLCESMSHIAFDSHFDVCATRAAATLNPHSIHFTQQAQYLSISQFTKWKPRPSWDEYVIHCHFQASLRLIHRCRGKLTARTPVNWNSIELVRGSVCTVFCCSAARNSSALLSMARRGCGERMSQALVCSSKRLDSITSNC